MSSSEFEKKFLAANWILAGYAIQWRKKIFIKLKSYAEI